MAELTQINLSRALKLKNRVVHRLSQLDTQITTYNSVIEDNQEYDVRQLYKARMVLAEQLVKLKVAINAANQPVQGLFFELAECKAQVAMLGKVNTKHGPSVEGFTGARTNYVAQFRKPDIDREVRRVEQEIDRLQDELDQFNHRTMIAVDVSLLAESEPPSGAIR
jgi:predicted  nucleic acid-binding Zn-ribbon protein